MTATAPRTAALAGALVMVALAGGRAAARGRARAALVGRLLTTSARIRPGPRQAPHWVAAALTDAGVAADARLVCWAWGSVAVMGVAAGLLLHTLSATVLLDGAAVAVAIGLRPWARRRAAARYDADLPIAWEAVAGALRSGASMTAALGDAAESIGPPLATDLGAVVRQADVVGLQAALARWTEARPMPGVRVAAAALSLGLETGGAQASAIDGVARGLRQQQAALAEAQALGTQARMSALVIALAPIGFGGLAAGLDPATASFLFRTGTGVLCFAAGISLDLIGGWWMARISRSVQ